MSEMIERVALAIMRVETEDKISDYYKFARAAIEAMRESTEAMLEAAWDRTDGLPAGADLYYEAWQAMIDAALSQSSGDRKSQ